MMGLLYDLAIEFKSQATDSQLKSTNTNTKRTTSNK